MLARPALLLQFAVDFVDRPHVALVLIECPKTLFGKTLANLGFAVIGSLVLGEGRRAPDRLGRSAGAALDD